MHRRLALSTAVVLAAIVGAVGAVAVRGSGRSHAQADSPPVTTAVVVRGDLAATLLTGGTLGYAASDPVFNRLTGTYTQLPSVGTRIARGQVLYRVDSLPVILMMGRGPSWRPFTAGMAGGPDVAELQSNLIALGDARGLFSIASGQFDWTTVEAVERWQLANGYPVTGRIGLGEVVFLPSAILVGAESVASGQAATPGQVPYLVTTTRRTVTIPLNPDLPSVGIGESVSVVLPAGASTPGRVTAIGPPPPGIFSGTEGNTASTALTVITVTPDRPAATGTGSGLAVQVSFTTQAVSGVLVLPVSALLALATGGYGVEVVGASGSHKLVGVRTGMYAGGRVQVSGAGIGPGTKVVVAQ